MAMGKEEIAMIFDKKRKKKEEQMAGHIWALLYGQEVPNLPKELRTIPLAEDIHRELREVRRVLQSYAAWDMKPMPESENILARYLKTLQANFRHIVFRIQAVLVEYEPPEGSPAFSGPFNEMVRHLEEVLQAKGTKLRQQAALLEMPEWEYRFRDLASWDPLTGALSRSSFIRRAKVELETAHVQQTELCVAIMDPDYFKKFNDLHGHTAGEDALKHLVEVVSGALRKTDFMGRYEEEKFVVFFPDTRLEICQMVCKRMLKQLSATPIRLASGTTKITMSIGLASMGWEAGAGKEPGYRGFSAEWAIYLLMTQADRALSQTKKEGRSRVVSYDGKRDGTVVWDVTTGRGTAQSFGTA
jgi:diguanylate cyclase (GGDEF)-like protein